LRNPIPKRTAKEEAKLLEEMRAYQEKRERIPDSEKIPISNPEKYSFPLGIGPDGRFFPSPAPEDAEKPDPKEKE
jgi:hypothetical protein